MYKRVCVCFFGAWDPIRIDWASHQMRQHKPPHIIPLLRAPSPARIWKHTHTYIQENVCSRSETYVDICVMSISVRRLKYWSQYITVAIRRLRNSDTHKPAPEQIIQHTTRSHTRTARSANHIQFDYNIKSSWFRCIVLCSHTGRSLFLNSICSRVYSLFYWRLCCEFCWCLLLIRNWDSVLVRWSIFVSLLFSGLSVKCIGFYVLWMRVLCLA